MIEMQSVLLQLVTLIVLHLSNTYCSTLSYDPTSDYLDVYPDPTDPTLLQGRTPLHFVLMQSKGGQLDSVGAVAGVKVALDRINNDTSLLPGYTLHYTFGDSMCNRTESLRSFFSQVNHEPTKFAVIGSGCSIATEPTAEVSHFYNISQLSCLATSPELENRIRFPHYYQLITSDENLAFVYIGVIREFGWNRVAILVQNENLFTSPIERLTEFLQVYEVEYNMKLFTELGELEEDGPVFDNRSRIFILSMYEANTRTLLCKAYEMNLRLPRYLFITIGWYAQFWWRIQDKGLSCSAADRESVLANSLSVTNIQFLHDVEDTSFNTTTGITGDEFLMKEKAFFNQPPLNFTFLEYSQFCYDATWTLAYALRKTLASINDPDTNTALARAYNVTPPFQLDDFTYNNDRLLDIISGHISDTSFEGITGRVNFGDEGVRNSTVLIVLQFRNVTNVTDGSVYLDLVVVGNVEEREDDYVFLYEPNENNETLFQGLIPYDGRPINQIVSVHVGNAAVFIPLACAGIAFTLFCLIFNFKYRNSKLIKLASSLLNNLIGIGAIVLYCSTITQVIPTTDMTASTILCNLTPWLTAIGYSLCYGTIMTKMLRVYYIFNYPSLKKKGIQDWMLLLGVGTMVSIDLVILITYTAVEGARDNLDVQAVPHRERRIVITGELGYIIRNLVFICDSISRDIFLGILYGYKMTLQIIALILAFSIRKVKVKGLDDSKYIATAIYVTSIVLAVIIVLTYSLKGYVNIFSFVFCTGFIAGTTVILLLVFVPLMVRLYKDPEGENIFGKTGGTEQLHLSLNGKNTMQHDNETLQRRIKELESRLEFINVTRESSYMESHMEKSVSPSRESIV